MKNATNTSQNACDFAQTSHGTTKEKGVNRLRKERADANPREEEAETQTPSTAEEDLPSKNSGEETAVTVIPPVLSGMHQSGKCLNGGHTNGGKTWYIGYNL